MLTSTRTGILHRRSQKRACPGAGGKENQQGASEHPEAVQRRQAQRLPEEEIRMQAPLHLHSGMGRRIRPSRSGQPHLVDEVLGETDRIPSRDALPPRATRPGPPGGQQHPEGLDGSQ